MRVPRRSPRRSASFDRNAGERRPRSRSKNTAGFDLFQWVDPVLIVLVGSIGFALFITSLVRSGSLSWEPFSVPAIIAALIAAVVFLGSVIWTMAHAIANRDGGSGFQKSMNVLYLVRFFPIGSLIHAINHRQKQPAMYRTVYISFILIFAFFLTGYYAQKIERYVRHRGRVAETTISETQPASQPSDRMRQYQASLQNAPQNENQNAPQNENPIDQGQIPQAKAAPASNPVPEGLLHPIPAGFLVLPVGTKLKAFRDGRYQDASVVNNRPNGDVAILWLEDPQLAEDVRATS